MDNIQEFEGRSYQNPQPWVDQTNQFIDNLRQIQQEDTARIAQDTYALGTQVPTNKGGLSGAESTFAEQYQTSQTEKMIADLKTAAQTTALNQALENTLAQYKKRYDEAYRDYQRRKEAEAKASSQQSTTTNTTPLDITTNDDEQKIDVDLPDSGYHVLVPTSDTTYNYESDDPLGKGTITYTLRQPNSLEEMVLKGHNIEFNARAQEGNTYMVNGVMYQYTGDRGWLVQTGITSKSM